MKARYVTVMPYLLHYSCVFAFIDYTVGNQSRSSIQIFTRRGPDSLSTLPEGSITQHAQGNVGGRRSAFDKVKLCQLHIIFLRYSVTSECIKKRHICRVNKCCTLESFKYSDTLLMLEEMVGAPPGCFHLFSENLHLTLGHWMPLIAHLE